jgi:hypothetical protein
MSFKEIHLWLKASFQIMNIKFDETIINLGSKRILRTTVSMQNLRMRNLFY